MAGSAEPSLSLKRSPRSVRSSEFQERIARLRLPVHPLFPFPLGDVHPFFPRTMLEFHLLTESQLDTLATYYHQTSPTHPYRHIYPACMNWDADFLAVPDLSRTEKEELALYLPASERIRIKRRMLGKFIGFAGCETPVQEVQRRVRFYDERIQRSVRRQERLKEQLERKNLFHRGAW